MNVDALPDVDMSSLAGRRVLVTGAAGFLGSHLVPRLIDRGAEVCAMDVSGARFWPLIEGYGVAAAVRADVRVLLDEAHDDALGPVDTIIHLAAVGVVEDGKSVRDLVSANVDGTMAVLLAAQRFGARLIYCGSCFEYGSGAAWSEDALPAPTSEYGASKVAGWMLAQAFAHRTGLELVSLRPFTMYGPREGPDRLVPSVVRHALAGLPIDLTPGDQVRDFVYVEDVADAFIAASTTDAAVGGTFNVCSGNAVTVRDIVQRVIRSTGSTAQARFGALAYRSTERQVLTGDTSRAERILGWRARVSLDEGLARTIEWNRTVAERLGALKPPTAATGSPRRLLKDSESERLLSVTADRLGPSSGSTPSITQRDDATHRHARAGKGAGDPDSAAAVRASGLR